MASTLSLSPAPHPSEGANTYAIQNVRNQLIDGADTNNLFPAMKYLQNVSVTINRTTIAHLHKSCVKNNLSPEKKTFPASRIRNNK